MIADGSRVMIQIGHNKTEATIWILQDEKNGIGKIDSVLYENLCMPVQSIKWRVRFDQKHETLHLGPFFSILTEIRLELNEQPSFGSIHCFAEELHAYTKESGGFLSIMKLPHLKQKNKDSKSYYLDEDNWQEASLPFPDVIYNRIHSRKNEMSESYRAFYSELLDKGTVIFNPQFLSKWEVHKLLGTEAHLTPYIPEADLYSPHSLNLFLEDYEGAFIKPIHGSQGRGIIEVRKTGDALQVSQTNYHSAKDHTFASMYELESILLKWIGKKACIIQQSLQLIDLEEKKVDFRLLVHPNSTKKWNVTSAVARLSAEKQFVSNLAQGGTIRKPMSVLQEFFDIKTATQIYSMMKELSTETASTLSKAIDGVAGEFGLDIGVDLNGKVWLIEVNSKPSKQTENIQSAFRPSTKAIWNFADILWQERRFYDD